MNKCTLDFYQANIVFVIGFSILVLVLIAFIIYLRHDVIKQRKLLREENCSKSYSFPLSVWLNRNISFKYKLTHDFIPHIYQMIQNESNHLDFLLRNDAPEDMIEICRKKIVYLKKTHQECIDLAEGLSD